MYKQPKLGHLLSAIKPNEKKRDENLVKEIEKNINNDTLKSVM